MSVKPFAFFFHFNKPLSQKKGKPVISLHYKEQCCFVDNVVCSVTTKGRVRKRQPRFVMCGRAHAISIQDGVAYIS